MSAPERAPVQGDGQWWNPRDKDAHPPGSIAWEEHLEVWKKYDEKWRSGQSAERIAQRGGVRLQRSHRPARASVAHLGAHAEEERDPMIEIECKRCRAKHYPRVLGKSLTCCSRHDGVTRLVAEYHDPIADRRWFAVSSQAIVRVLK